MKAEDMMTRQNISAKPPPLDDTGGSFMSILPKYMGLGLLILAVPGCAGSGGFCQQSANAGALVCRLSDAEQAALPVKAEWWHPTLAVTLHPLDTPAQRDGLRRAVGGHGGMALAGIAVPDPDSARCDIYVSLPDRPSAYEMQAVGHELFHCFAGGFHPDMLTGKAASSYLSPLQAAEQRDWFSTTLEAADEQSRWTVSCTFGVGSCPQAARSAIAPLRLTVHPVDQGERAVPDARAGRCDLYLPMPTTYLGSGMEALGRLMLMCFKSQRPSEATVGITEK